MELASLQRLTTLVLAKSLAFILIAGPVAAQRTPRLVRDVAPGADSSPSQMVAVGDRIYFRACEPATGCEPWTSDGTEAGTAMLLDVFPGVNGSSSRLFTAVGGQVFFVADDGPNGPELWVTDGTPGGTVLVENIRPGGTGAEISERSG